VVLTEAQLDELRAQDNYCGFSDGPIAVDGVMVCDERESGCTYCTAMFYEGS